MNKLKLLVASIALFSVMGSSAADTADTKDTKHTARISPLMEVVTTVAYAIGMSDSDLDRAFKVITDFQIGKLRLPELDSLSDEQVLARVDFQSEPYVSLDSERMILMAKRYELEVEMLAAHANIDPYKFRQFYSSFDMAITTGMRLSGYLTSGDSHPSSDKFDGAVVECAVACEAVNQNVVDNLSSEFFNIMEDLDNWEDANGQQPLGATIRLVDSDTGNFIEMRRPVSSMRWVITAPQNCDKKACV